jgi:hypothetical protein
METVNEKQQVLYTALEFMDKPPIHYLDAEKLLPAESLVLLVGQPGTAKSLWALKLAVEISKEATVVVVLGEGQAGYPDRLRAAREIYRHLNEHLHIHNKPVNLKEKEQVTNFITLINEYRIHPKLFIFDTLSTCSAGADENSVRDMTRVMESCKELQNTFHATVLLIHHSTKDGETYRGSSVLHGVIDAMYFTSAKKEKKIQLTCKKMKDGDQDKVRYYEIVTVKTRTNPETKETTTGAALDQIEALKEDPDHPHMTPQAWRVLEVHSICETQCLRQSDFKNVADIASSSTSKALERLLLGYEAKDGNTFCITEEGKAALKARSHTDP